MKQLDSNTLLSKSVDVLRFPLMVGILFIHNNLIHFDVIKKGEYFTADLFIYLFSNIIGSLCVPLFFFISGYYFFYGCEKFDLKSYKNKIYKRIYSLFLPYIIWNFITILVYYFIVNHPFSFASFCSSFWEYNHYDLSRSTPINGPLWFLRDLILVSIISPIIYWIIKKCNVIPIVILLVIWIFSSDYYSKFFSLSFYSLGAYFSIKKDDLFFRIGKYKEFLLGTFLLLVVVLNFLFMSNIQILYLPKIYILIGLFTTFYLTSEILTNTNVKINSFWASSSFFLYLAHNLIEGKIRMLIKGIIGVDSSFQVLGVYFIPVILTILILLSLYYILKRYLPILSFFWGGR